jgi:hypothetical protein
MGVRIGLLLKQDERRTKTGDKKLLRSVLGYIQHDHKTDEETREINMCSLYGIIVNHRCRCVHHLLRMNGTSIPSLMYENPPTDRQNRQTHEDGGGGGGGGGGNKSKQYTYNK